MGMPGIRADGSLGVDQLISWGRAADLLVFGVRALKDFQWSQ